MVLSWRDRETEHEETAKPDLQALLEHYGLYVTRSDNYTCIFHDERRASMSVDLNKQLVNCFTCGVGGDTWRIIEIKEGVDFAGAREWATATSLAPAEGVAGGSDDSVQSFGYSQRGTVAKGKRDRKERSIYRPSWSGS